MEYVVSVECPHCGTEDETSTFWEDYKEVEYFATSCYTCGGAYAIKIKMVPIIKTTILENWS